MNKSLTWFRFYTEALDDPKVQRLPAHTFRAWINLLCVAAQRSGTIPTIDDVAFRLRISTGDAQSYVDELILVGLIDVKRDGTLKIHAWETRQYLSDTSTDRVRKHRKKQKKLECNVSETLHGTAPEQSRTETEVEIEENPNGFSNTAHFTSEGGAAREKVKGSGQFENFYWKGRSKTEAAS